MKTLLGSIAVLMTVSVAALATSAEGIIQSIDRETLVITLDDGKSYKLPGEIDMSAISEGMEILIAYDEMGGKNQITDLILSE